MKYFLKNLSLIFTFLLCFTTSAEAATPPELNAQGSTLIDATTGTVLYGKEENTQFEPASTTKVMTALLTLENCSLTDQVTVTENFTSIDGTAIGLLKDDVVTVHDLLLGLLLESGNDCANALAYHVSGSIEAFAQLMTERAAKLGATNTVFKNPSGLPDTEHLTTPHDLALILKEAIKNKEFLDISRTPMAQVTIINHPEREITINNKNYLINKNSKYYYQYALSGKSGYTIRANHTFVVSAEKDGHILVGSFLYAVNKDQNFADMKNLFEYGFNNFSFVKAYKKDTQIAEYKINDELTIPLLATDDIDLVVPKETESTLSYEIKVEEADLKKSSFNKGDKILKGKLYVDGKEYSTIDLAAGTSKTYEDMPTKAKEIITSHKYESVIQVAVAAVIGIAVLTQINSRKHKNKHAK